MREYLFRGKQNGSWIEGNLLVDESGNCYIGTYLKSSRCYSFVAGGGRQQGKTANRFLGIGFVLVDPETVGQFTGRTDKNGKKIFEHDVVRFDNGVFVVRFYDSRMGFGFSGLFGRGCVPGFTMTSWEHIEIIGNIHDNPELLEDAHV